MVDSKLIEILLYLGFEHVKENDVRLTKYIKKIENINIDIDDYEGIEQFYTFMHYDKYIDKSYGYFLWDFNNIVLNRSETKDIKSVYNALNKEFPHIMRKYKINDLLKDDNI